MTAVRSTCSAGAAQPACCSALICTPLTVPHAACRSSLLLKRHVLTPFAVPAGLAATVRCVLLMHVHAAALQASHGISMGPRITRDLWPPVEQVSAAPPLKQRHDPPAPAGVGSAQRVAPPARQQPKGPEHRLATLQASQAPGITATAGSRGGGGGGAHLVECSPKSRQS